MGRPRLQSTMVASRPRIEPVLATVSANGLMHVPKTVQEGLGIERGEQVVIFVNRADRRATMVPAREAFAIPDSA